MLYHRWGANRRIAHKSKTLTVNWTAYFLARGYRVTISDPAPAVETYVRAYIENAWPNLEQANLDLKRQSRIGFEPTSV